MTPQRIAAMVCAALAVLSWCIAGSYCEGCTASERAPIESDLQKAMSAENIGCLLATHANLPVDDHALVLAICAIAPTLTQGALALLQAEDVARVGARDAGGP